MIIVTEAEYLETYTTFRFYDTNIRKWKSLRNYDYNLHNCEEVEDDVVEELYQNNQGEISDYVCEIQRPSTKDFHDIDELITKDYDISSLLEIRYNVFYNEKEIYKTIVLAVDAIMIKDEIQNYHRFSHENVMKINHILVDKDEVVGFTIPRGRPLLKFDPPHIKLKWLIEVLKGIYYFGEIGFIHKDIKADNVIILDDEAKIIDLGGMGQTPYWHKPDDPDDLYSFRKLLIELYVESPPMKEDGSDIHDENIKFIYDNCYDIDKVLSKFNNYM